MPLVLTFGTPAPASSVPEETDSNCQSQNTPETKFPCFKAFMVSYCLGLSNNGRPALSGKVTTISYIGYQIQIARFQIQQGPSLHAPRLLRGAESSPRLRLGTGNENLKSYFIHMQEDLNQTPIHMQDIAEIRWNGFAFESRLRIFIPSNARAPKFSPVLFRSGVGEYEIGGILGVSVILPNNAGQS
ncbi:hypothetical protein TNCV_1769491 [Trichonephila clavipes]|nr:hypothetical protein TNCV_1769491 [Trichonephila clavipes]